ncbi:MAG TPA: glycosyltransferase family A protein [Candidatus Competibacter sp.]|nr:glycosyltransferase family 2 protein [Candidatus Competibacteraceae bacterium]HRW64687.1 glycosyltransferase family A protein [Candidatus Competibacter sp.]
MKLRRVMREGLVSTIIPVFNRPALMREAVASVLAQTYRPIEIIIVDDGSTDETGRVAEALAMENPDVIRVLHIANGGPGVAREAGRQLVRGEFVQYLDSDDLLLPCKFVLQVQGLRANPACGVAYGKTRCYQLGNKPMDVSLKRTGEKIETMFPSFLKSRWWSTNTPLFKRELLDRAGPWKSLFNEEDWEYDCRVAALGIHLCFCDEYVADTRFHKEGHLSSDGSSDPRKLKSRAKAHELILSHARRAGIGPEIPEMQHFARELFLLARQCGAAGLAAEARELFRLARAASGSERSSGLDFRLYRLLARMIGWARAGRLTCAMDRWRG